MFSFTFLQGVGILFKYYLCVHVCVFCGDYELTSQYFLLGCSIGTLKTTCLKAAGLLCIQQP